MRTTLNLDDDILPLVKSFAESRSLPLGKAVSELVRRGLAARRSTRTLNGLAVFEFPPDSPTVTTKLVKAIEAGDE